MENFSRKMTISCYLMFQILGARLGPREDRNCVIPDIFNFIWQDLLEILELQYTLKLTLIPWN